MTEAAAQQELRKIAEELDSIRLRLVGVNASLPVPPNEGLMLAGEEDMDVATEVRSIVECILNDYLGPAARDLRTAADYVPDQREEK